MTLIELKSQAYDCLANIEHLQKQLQEINQMIAQKMQEEKAEQ
jgi:2-iminoacetate synthase ThiH